jgi:hypothetical protein
VATNLPTEVLRPGLVRGIESGLVSHMRPPSSFPVFLERFCSLPSRAYELCSSHANQQAKAFNNQCRCRRW